jgi:hypothetical protein
MPSDRDRPDEDLDAAFAAIIAGWDDIPSLDDQVAGAPSSDDTDEQARRKPDRREGDTKPSDEGDTGPSDEGRAGPLTDVPRRPASDARDVDPAPYPAPEQAPTTPTSGPRDWAAAEDPDDDRYHPPEPPPLPRGDLVGRLAWAGVLLGPAFLLVAGLFWRGAPRLWLALAVLAFVGGFVTLVLRLPADRDDTDGDDGAVV